MNICFLAQFPPPIHGLSKAVDTLFCSKINNKYKFSAINITKNSNFIKNLFLILLNKSELFYFTISQSVAGNIRDMLFLLMIRLKGKKCIVHLHGGYYRKLMQEDCNAFQRFVNRKLMNKVDRCIVLGNSLIGMFEGYVPLNRIRVVPNCIDNEFLPTKIEEKILSIRNNSIIHVVYLSNFIEEKGYREVLEVAQEMKKRERENDFVFHFAGNFFNEEERRFFNKFVRHYQLKNVDYHGVVMGVDKQELLKKCHVMILLTRYPKEGQPISLLEGMGNGIAIVTTNHSGIPDIVTVRNGYICDKNHINIDSVANYLEKCLNERDYLIGVCKNNYYWVKNNFTEENYINNMDKVFEEVYHGT